MKVTLHALRPRMQHGKEPDLTFQSPLGIAGESLEHPVHRCEQLAKQKPPGDTTRSFSSCGSVKTLWKYCTGINSRRRLLSHFSLALVWQVGQCRS